MGYVLMDCLAAMALLGIGVMVAMTFFRTEVREIRASHDRFSALLIAQSEVERLHTLSFDDLKVGKDRPLDLNLPSAARLKGARGRLTVRETAPGLRAATVRIEWESPTGTPLRVELQCLFSREGAIR